MHPAPDNSGAVVSSVWLTPLDYPFTHSAADLQWSSHLPGRFQEVAVNDNPAIADWSQNTEVHWSILPWCTGFGSTEAVHMCMDYQMLRSYFSQPRSVKVSQYANKVVRMWEMQSSHLQQVASLNFITSATSRLSQLISTCQRHTWSILSSNSSCM